MPAIDGNCSETHGVATVVHTATDRSRSSLNRLRRKLLADHAAREVEKRKVEREGMLERLLQPGNLTYDEREGIGERFIVVEEELGRLNKESREEELWQKRKAEAAAAARSSRAARYDTAARHAAVNATRKGARGSEGRQAGQRERAEPMNQAATPGPAQQQREAPAAGAGMLADRAAQAKLEVELAGLLEWLPQPGQLTYEVRQAVGERIIVVEEELGRLNKAAL